MAIKIGIPGVVRQGHIQGWYILVKDVTEGSTSGYYIFISKDRDFASEVVDDWIEKKHLEDYFKEANWDLKW